MELVTNGDEGMKCEDWTETDPWVEAGLWGYDKIGDPRDLDDPKAKFRCHFCKTEVENPKPYDAVCGDGGCEALFAISFMGVKKL